MKQKHIWILLTIAAIITIYGVVSGRFFFLFLIFPLGLGVFRKKNKEH